MTDPEMGRHSPRYELAPADATEPKVMAATGGATAGVIVTNFLLDLISRIFCHGGAVPVAWSLFVALVVTSGLTFAGGWYAHHVNRA